MIVKKIVLGVAVMLLVVGCGSSGGKTYVANPEPAAPEVPSVGGDAFVITSSGEGSAGMSYTSLEDGSVLVDCGSGGCGDIYVASPQEQEQEQDESLSTSGCSDSTSGSCS